jgi:hypothetical protein
MYVPMCMYDLFLDPIGNPQVITDNLITTLDLNGLTIDMVGRMTGMEENLEETVVGETGGMVEDVDKK